jgi:hypothetical protein
MKKRRILFFGVSFLYIFFQVSTAQVLTSSNLPIVVINTNGQSIPDEPKIPAFMGIIDNGPGETNSILDPFNDYEGNIGIELRGSSSQALFDKKSYGIETWDENLQDTSVSILGMPAEEDWVLYGPYSDKTLIRNLLAFKLGRELGWYASRTRLCELVLNNEYWGVYVFMEKVKRDKNRVDISKLNPDEISGDDLTGGYIVKIDKFDGSNSGQGWASPYRPPNFSRTEQTIFFQFDYPKNDEIVPQQKAYIQQYVTDFETALRTRALDDPVAGYKSYVDIYSFIDYAILNEITRNIDAYRLSTFLYKDKASQGGKLVIGPIWDYNLAFGNANYCDGWRQEGWAWDFNDVCNEDYWLIPFWWERFMMDVEFTSLLKNRWFELRSEIFSTSRIFAYIDSVTDVLDKPQVRNFQRWNIMGQYIWPNYYVGNTYQEEVDYIKRWLDQRLSWLDRNMEDIITSLDDKWAETARINLFPNPFDQELTVELKNLSETPVLFQVFNLYGQRIFEQSINEETLHSHGFVWDGRDIAGQSIPPGIYLSVLKSGDKVIYQSKLIRN